MDEVPGRKSEGPTGYKLATSVIQIQMEAFLFFLIRNSPTNRTLESYAVPKLLAH